MKWIFFFLFSLVFEGLFSQKILQMEHIHKVRATKFYTGDVLYFKLKGRENYWYQREITDILPKSNLIMLDLQPTPIGSIAAIKLPKPRIMSIIGTALMSFGATLTLATGYAALRGDKPRSEILLPVAVASFGVGIWMAKPRTHKMGKKRRLRVLEIGLQ